MNVELVDYTKDSIIRIEQFAKVSRKNRQADCLKISEDFVRKLISLGHESVLECAYATFYVSGISRVCSHQLVRHRLASYCQKSQRHCNEADGDYIVPHTIPENLYNDMINTVETCREFYEKLINAGVPIEDARYFLPQGWTTDIMITMNFRELRHFFKTRRSPEAQWEIRELASKMLEKCLEIAYPIFEDIKYSIPKRFGQNDSKER